MNDADDESDELINQPTNSGASCEGGVQDSRDNRLYSYADETYDPEDPRYDVRGAIRAFGNNGFKSNTSGAEQAAQTLSDDDDHSNNYTCLQRDFTNASLVPPPLRVLMRRNNTVHETSSPTVAPVTATQPVPRPASAADVDTLPLEEPEIETRRPRSFVVHGWPPQNQNATFDNASQRQAMWYTPPTEEIIERSRRAREQMEWEEEAKKIVLQKARERGETLSDEEVARRVRRMYERSSRFTLEALAYMPPAQPRDAVDADRPRNGRVRAQRAPRDSLSGSMNVPTSQNNRPAGQAPSFASSQALPFAASATSVTAQDGSRSGSPPRTSDAPRAPRRRLRRSNPDQDLSHAQ